jgi:pyruvate dehydrogenase E2 component (dihydrolipoamide acetyltransferase)
MGAMHDLRMPKLGLTMTEGTLAEWKVEPGQPVRRGELLFVAETEKVANEIEASADGSIGEIRVLAGTTVPVGEVLATCSNAGGPASAAAEGARPAPTALNTSAPITRRDVVVGPRVVATPLARRLAKQSGIDLHTLRGGGPNGRIKAHDVLGARGERSGALQYAECVIPATSTRRAATRYETTVASRLATAKRDVPHFYAALEADIGPALALREQLNASPRRQRISVTHVLIAGWPEHCSPHPRLTAYGATARSRNSRQSTLDLRWRPSVACSRPFSAMSAGRRSTRSRPRQGGWWPAPGTAG